MDEDKLDAAAEDPPLGPFLGALLGSLAVVAGLGWLVLSLVLGVPSALLAQLGLVGAGVVGFAISMVRWNPDVDTAPGEG